MASRHRSRVFGFFWIMAILAVVIAAIWASSAAEPRRESVPPSQPDPILQTVEVLESMPHDPRAYTQGLFWFEGHFYESTGQYGQSTVRRVDPATGEVLLSQALSPELFGEGLARVDDQLIQLTWRAGEALVWDRVTLAELGRRHYPGEGWGLCFDGRHLVMSDGSSVLAFRDPETLELDRQVEVRLRDGAVGRLNELECVEGRIYANVFTTDWIVRIDPLSGQVESLIDASGLLTPEESRGADVLNGIAYDAESQVFYLTGKLWPKIFAVRFVSAAAG